MFVVLVENKLVTDMKKQTRPALRTADKLAAKKELAIAKSSAGTELAKKDKEIVKDLEKVVEILVKKVDDLTNENIKLQNSLKKLSLRLKNGFDAILKELISEKKF